MSGNDFGYSNLTPSNSGIASDIISGLSRLVFAILRNGSGVAQNYITEGNTIDFKIAENSDYLFPALTVVNQGTANVRVGFSTTAGGLKGVLLLPQAAVTFKWLNPRRSQLVVNDLGTSGMEIDVFG